MGSDCGDIIGDMEVSMDPQTFGLAGGSLVDVTLPVTLQSCKWIEFPPIL